MPARQQEQAQIAAIGKSLTQFTERTIVAITLELHAELVEHTPVDTGWARANWVPKVGGQPPQNAVGSPGAGGVPAAQGASQAGISSVLAYRLPRGRVYVTNNVSYIEALNDGHSSQEPAGFVQRALRKAVQAAVG